MKKTTSLLSAVLISLPLTGCIAPSMQSMGSAPMVTAHQPKMTAANEKQIDLSVDAFGTVLSEGLNVEQVSAGGGAATFDFHPSGALSPLFVSASVAGYAGSLQFGCNDMPCSKAYTAWLDTDDGDENYTFWNIQERIMGGAEFNLGSHLLLGAGGGIQFYQGGGDFDSKRDRMEKAKLVENIDDKFDWKPTASVWFGPRLGDNGGVITVQYDVNFAQKVKEWNTQLSVSYFHPTGFHGGVATNSNMSFVATLGKTFLF